MSARAIRQPLLVSSRLSNATRGYKTAARTKRSLTLPPHESMQPSTASSDTIIYNPPSSAASVFHTPFKFLPKTDPRRTANLDAILGTKSSLTMADLPPPLDVPSRGDAPSYHLTRADALEIQRLRAEDPEKWSIAALATKFKCSKVFITVCTAAPAAHKEKLAKQLELVQSRWGPRRRQAREDRTKRKQMLFRGEL
ncbi:hypothetical protein TD95_002874 [Thielaviopsis punctulata]|uniref:Uncharacterized protein n=1 Tax=Thielaviopsis punctulata TaxID=72032 RepID=A0A0F4ZFY3_9PEZI|nr:hypothetical protein TD95_002874 [Thielaviopsis punctulata]